MNVCQRNVARFRHVECRFDKINDLCQGFGSLVSLRFQKDGGAKSKQIWFIYSDVLFKNLPRTKKCVSVSEFASVKYRMCKICST